ncbi:MAG: hypothetical protein GXY15_01205 [Candidatus Hydrogenedentes bacterium]|nr:hypothetical protein [Candidatus Hydrogenedentota bacterium]
MTSEDRKNTPSPLWSDWHHAPVHRFTPNRAHMTTAATLRKEPYFRGEERLSLLQDTLLGVLHEVGWRPQAWAVFPNHYHLVAAAPGEEGGAPLCSLVQRAHSLSARELNRLDGAPGRKVWFQYWDTVLSYERSYFARLNYTHNNPVKHGVVACAENYPHCSAAWFSQNAEDAFRRKVASFGYGRVNVVDDFEV